VLLTYLPYKLCRCVSFLVAVVNSFWLHSFKERFSFGFFNRITATGAYMHHRFLRASFKLNNFVNFCLFATFHRSKCTIAELFNLASGVRVRVGASRAKDVSRGSLAGLRFNCFFSRWSTVRKLGKSCVLLVFFFFSKSSTMAAARAIRRGHLPDGGI
jgi:hypothetical protein